MIMDDSSARQIARILLETNAVVLRPENPFTWASGWKSPIYCDNRIILGYVSYREIIIANFVDLISKTFKSTEVIAGVATAGIPHASFIADRMKLPLCYVRSGKKGHGKGNQIEGSSVNGKKVVVVEDLISTGMSSLEAVVALKEAGAEIVGAVSIFTYQFPQADEAFKKENIVYHSLSGYSILIEEAAKQNYVSKDEISLLQEWRKNPAKWGK
jgi:orotate phosphoribosyltransferase